MANIALKGTYDATVREFQSMGTNIQRMDNDWLVACRRTINQINRQANLQTRITRPEVIETTIALDEDYEDVLSAGISYHLMLAGRRPAKGGPERLQEFLSAFLSGIDQIRYDIDNQLLDDDTDDDTYDLALLGHLG